MRVLVLGFDGADWELISNWANKGKLPNFKKLMSQGVFGPLKSTIPPITPPAWTSMVTGKNPGKHGIYSFIKLEKIDNSWKKLMYTSRDKKSKELWDYINNSIVVNVPFTYPPKKINGIMVTGMLTPSIDSEFTYPPEFKNEIKKKFPDYMFELEPIQYSNKTQEFLKKLYKMTNEQIKLFWYLFKRNWNLMFFVFIGPDRIQHILWKTRHMEEYWKYLDSFLGNVLEEIKQRDDTILIIVSDHGFGETNKIVYINNLLVEKNYLIPKMKNDKLNIYANGNLLKKVSHYLLPIYNSLPHILKLIIRGIIKYRTSLNLFDDFDLDRSKAFFMSYSGLGGIIYINKKYNSKKIKKELKTLLEELTDPTTGEKIIERIYDAEEIYTRFTNKHFEVLVIIPKEGYSTYENIKYLSSNTILDTPKVEKANHRFNGILFIYGIGIKKGYKLENAEIYDIAPTILHIFGLPIPKDMDGRVLVEIFEPDSEFAKREPKYVDPSYYDRISERQKIRARLNKIKTVKKL